MAVKKFKKPATTLRSHKLYELRYRDYIGTDRLCILAAPDETEAIKYVKHRFGYCTFISLSVSKDCVWVPTGVE